MPTEVIFNIVTPAFYQGPDIRGYTAEYDKEVNYDVTDIHLNRTWSVDRQSEGFRLKKLEANTSYLIKFAAENDVGRGAWSPTFGFRTLEP